MSFEYDIFISYGHIDDEDPAGDVKGWVDLLVERLPRLVASFSGVKPRVWRDERSLGGNDLLHEAIGRGVTRSRLFVPVVTPRYVLSDWCRRELDTFCAAGPLAGAGSGAYRSRIFKVVKTPLMLPHLKEKEPAVLRELKGYHFYDMQDEELSEEFSPDTVPAKDQRYWNTLRRLALDIMKMLADMADGAAPAEAQAPTPACAPAASPVTAVPAAPAGASAPRAAEVQPQPAPAPDGAGAAAPSKLVYLAETTSDLTKEREAVSDELRQRGYGVLPAQKLPLEERARTEEAVRADLARCCLSVHMVGARYGSTPEDDPASVVRIQEGLAAERAEAEPSFLRILWMPPGLATPAYEVTDARQREFVEGLQRRVAAGSELLQTTVEELKTRAVEKLAPKPQQPPQAAGGPRRPKFKRVYLICENADRSLVRPIREYLFEEKFEVISWLDTGADAERRMEYHRKYLRECDAALIYFGNTDVPWVRTNIEDLDKAYGYGREQDWGARAVYVGAPPNEQKEDFYTIEMPVIRNLSGFNPEDLRKFVSAVRAAEGGQQ